MPNYRINPDHNQPWNSIPPLPLDESCYKTMAIMEALVEAKSALAQLHGRSIAIPNPGLLINTISLQEAKASSQIENIFTTDDELYKAFSQNNIPQLAGSAKEVLHYREAIWQGHELLTQAGAFNNTYFEAMYRTVTGNPDGYRPPIANVRILQGGTGPNAGKTLFTPPKGKDVLPQLMQNLLAFVNQAHHGLDPLIQMAIAHFQFEAIHPFRDGNGRTGRLFNIHFLTHKGLLESPILYLSKYIIEHKDGYYSGLEGVWQRGSWHTWILYMLDAVRSTALLTFQKINAIVETRSIILDTIREQTAIRNPERLVEVLFQQPYARVAHLTEANIYSENTARNYLNTLAEIGVVQKRTISGHHYYLNTELYHILAD